MLILNFLVETNVMFTTGHLFCNWKHFNWDFVKYEHFLRVLCWSERGYSITFPKWSYLHWRLSCFLMNMPLLELFSRTFLRDRNVDLHQKYVFNLCCIVFSALTAFKLLPLPLPLHCQTAAGHYLFSMITWHA